MFCMNCGKEIPDDAKVCEYCGEPVQDDEEVIGNEAEPVAEPAPSESASAGPVPAPGPVPMPVQKAPKPKKEKKQKKAKEPGEKGKSKLPLILGIIAAALVLLAVVFGAFKFIRMPGKSSKDKPLPFPGVYFIQDNELWFNKFGRNKPLQVADDLFENDDLSNYSYSSSFGISKDGKYIFFAQDYNGGDSNPVYDLYYMKADGKGDAKRIAKSVKYYRILDDNRILYVDEDMDLYISNLKDSTKVGKELASIYSFYLEENQKYVLWRDSDNTLYCQQLDLKKDKIKLDRDVTGVPIYTANLKTIVYSKSDGISSDVYMIKNFGEKEKLLSNVDSFRAYMVNDKVNIYYAKTKDDSSVSVMDFIDDDLAAEDKLLKEPDIKDYTTYTTVNGWFGPTTREEVDDAYYDAVEKYNEKLDRDYWRESLQNQTVGLSEGAIYYYVEGKEEQKVDSGIIDMKGTYQAENEVAVVLYGLVDIDNIEKAKLSEVLEDGYDYNEISTKVLESTQLKMAKGTKIVDVSLGEDAIYQESGMISESKGTIYIFARESEDADDWSQPGELYSVNISSGRLGQASLIDSDVMYTYGVFSDQLYYGVDYDEDDETVTLKVEGKEIDQDVAWISVSQTPFSGVFAYYTDYDNEKKQEGTLNIYKNGKSYKVADDVHSFHVYNDKYIAVITDYSSKKLSGDLGLYNGKDCKTIATDVSLIVY